MATSKNSKTTATKTTFDMDQFKSYEDYKAQQRAQQRGYQPIWGVENWTRICGFVVNRTPVLDSEGSAILDSEGKPKEKVRVHLVLGMQEGVLYTLSLDGGRSQWFLEMKDVLGITPENIGQALVVNGSWSEPREFTTRNGLTLTRRICELQIEPLIQHPEAVAYF